MLPILLVAYCRQCFVAVTSFGKNDDNPKTKQSRILRNVGMMLEEAIIAPKIDDIFFQRLY